MPTQVDPYFVAHPPGTTQEGVQYGGSLKEISPVLWRLKMRQASFKAAAFHVESQGRVSGRRTVLHEYPKLDVPYAEDLGLHARRYQITGYVIQRWKPKGNRSEMIGNMPWNYDDARDNLIEALESIGPGTLVDPYSNRVGPMLFQCERYSMTETRERGGYAQFEMAFVEAGATEFPFVGADTTQQVAQSSDAAIAAAQQQMNTLLRLANDPAGFGPG